MDDLISRQQAIKDAESWTAVDEYEKHLQKNVVEWLKEFPPSAQPETATVTIGRTKGGVVMWYECDACGESIDRKDCYCRNCGRKLTLPEPYRRGEK